MATINELKERPVIKLPYTRAELILESVAAVGVLALVALMLTVWPHLPAKVPFSAAGGPIRFAPKESIFTLPFIETIFYLLITVCFFFPNFLSYPAEITKRNAEAMYRVMRLALGYVKAVMSWFFTLSVWRMLVVAQGHRPGLLDYVSYLFPVALLAALIIFPILFSKAKEGTPLPQRRSWPR